MPARIRLERLAPHKSRVFLDGICIGKIMRIQGQGYEKLENEGWQPRYECRYLAFGPGQPADFDSKVEAVRSLVLRHVAFRERVAA